MAEALQVALVGNPNCGKSSLFNALTGMRQKVGNFPGVTVDRKSGQFQLRDKRTVRLVDLPGIYSLYARSDDERVTAHVLHDRSHPDHPDVVVLVADATNMRRSLLLATEVMDLGLPMVMAINMTDLLDQEQIDLDHTILSKVLGIPVVMLSALRAAGLESLRVALSKPAKAAPKPFFQLSAAFRPALDAAAVLTGQDADYLNWQALMRPDEFPWLDQQRLHQIAGEHQLADPEGLMSSELAVRYDRIDGILKEVEARSGDGARTRLTEKLDRILLHKVWGMLIFIGLLFLIFQSVFAWATIPMDLIDAGFGGIGDWLSETLPEGFFTDMLVNGLWAGLGGIVIFVPQIAILFLFISILEDSGYMSRVVFLMDRIMRPFGFSGKSVIPLIGGMACAVPSIMMARGIPNRTERMITILVTPLMSCSARIPVYVLLINLFVPENESVWFFNLQGLILAGMYFLGFFMALLVAWVIKTISKYKSNGIFVTELPLYRIPRWKNAFLNMYHKSSTFVWEAGKVIIVISVILWLMSTYGPGDKMAAIAANYDARIEAAGDNPEEVERLKNKKSSEVLKASYAGHLGKAIEPVIRPLGFDWKIGISLVTSFAAREVFVGTMATLYSAGEEAAEDEGGQFASLRQFMKEEVNPDTGEPIYTTATAISLLIFYAFAMQCMSTLAVVRKETRSWKMTFLMLFYMTGLAYVASLVTYQLLA